MARFLFVVPPFVGHINPTISVGDTLAARGHAVAWVGTADPLARLLPREAQRFLLDRADEDQLFPGLRSRFQSVRGFQNLKLMWDEVFIPMARLMLPGVLAAAERYRPDVLVSDQQTIAGALAARRLGLRWATSATTPADRVRALEAFPKVLAWTEERLADLQREVGLDPVSVPEDSPSLVLSFTTEALAGVDARTDRQYRYVGPALGRRPDETAFPWDKLRSVPKVLVSLGTLNAERGGPFFERIKQALADLPIQVILVAPESFGPFPENFIVQPWVPQLKLLPAVDLLLSHAGSNTVCEALALALPVVVVPITDGQPVVAQQVADSGCGLRLSFKRSNSGAIRTAVERALTEPGFRAAAARIRESFEVAGGAPRAADLLESLAADQVC
ncbi:glycosyltransferase, MGT family [Thioflavicoccus mobilis 8321]|uniref:Glycosyltransferase, MGT family n=1 Tax=Thioflavicoccus mobilis 8321 TaxID=765912 RepID=L0GY45_9GAMM|nr:nucleotide disphospho-sugar-binding domain-containing protein [Thioflavicoccus mobilis]AGA90229.1 glycosyltransferase, MGT family [Thioflavicoccus mobilis 8321]